MRSRALLLFTALMSAGSGLTPAFAQVTPQPAPVTAHPHVAFIAEASQRFGIPEHWIRAVLRVESAGDVRAISHGLRLAPVWPCSHILRLAPRWADWYGSTCAIFR